MLYHTMHHGFKNIVADPWNISQKKKDFLCEVRSKGTGMLDFLRFDWLKNMYKTLNVMPRLPKQWWGTGSLGLIHEFKSQAYGCFQK